MAAAALVRFIHELFEILDNLLKYNSKLNNPEKPSVFGTGWKACATQSYSLVWQNYPGIVPFPGRP